MIKISSHAQGVLDGLHDRYASQTYRRFYGKSPYRNWQIQFARIIDSLEHTINKFGKNLSLNTDWGEIYYDRLKFGRETIIYVTMLRFNYRDLHNWFTSARYPSTTISRSKSLKVNSISFVKPYRYITLPNGKRIYAIQSDTHLYSLADKGKQQVIKYWFTSLSFPMNMQIENLNIIGWGDIDNIPYYIDDNLQLHHGAEIATLQKNKRFESRNMNNVLRLTEAQFKRMLTECITKIINEIA